MKVEDTQPHLSASLVETFNLIRLACQGNGRTRASNAWLAAKIGVAECTMKTHVETLKAAGWITIEKDARMTRQIFCTFGNIKDEGNGFFSLERVEKKKVQRPTFEVRKTKELARDGLSTRGPRDGLFRLRINDRRMGGVDGLL
jgi:hypothetical protein